MPRTKYRKKTKNGNTYYFYRLRHKNLRSPRDLYGKSIAELEEKINALKYELDRGVTSSNAYFGDYLNKWLTDVRLNGKKPNTAKRYTGLYEKYIKPYPIANIQLKSLTSLDIQEHYKKLVSEGVSKSTIKILSNIVHPCVRYAFSQNKILTDFSRSIIIPDAKDKLTGTRRASRALLPDEEQALLKACNGDKWELLIITALNSGLRAGELMALTWNDIDLDKRLLSVNKTYNSKSKGTPITSPKTKSSIRKVPLPSFLIPLLKKRRVEQIEEKLKAGSKYTDNNLVFCNAFGRYLASTTIINALKGYAKEIGIDSLNMHDFRDTYATKLYYETRDLKMIQTLLGHSNISTTADIYTKVSVEEASKYVKILDDMHQAAYKTE